MTFVYLLRTIACSQDLSVSMTFGGKTWPINSQDMAVQQEPDDSTLCIGAIFDLDAGTSITPNSGNPGWVVGDTFLVCIVIYR
jgi:cathepsin D